MPDLTIISWRDIPAQVVVKLGRAAVKRELPARFQEAIDMAAMRSGARDSDTYLDDWKRSEPARVDGALDEIADAEAARLDAAFDDTRLKALIAAGGRAS